MRAYRTTDVVVRSMLSKGFGASVALTAVRAVELPGDVEQLGHRLAVGGVHGRVSGEPCPHACRKRAVLALPTRRACGPHRRTALLMPAMAARGHGTVVNIASTGAYVPAPYLAVYAATKAYVLSFTQALWAETHGTGVRVVAVSPGPTKTPMNSRGTRSAEAVAVTVFRALSSNRPTVIDGNANTLTTFSFGTLLPRRLTLAIARRMMMARSGD
jgi:NAD(P)-dependent dehydrogenase (short-subunit alcohol dehydrogenase family)